MSGTFEDRFGREWALTLTVADLRPLHRLGFEVAKLANGGDAAAEVLFGDSDAMVSACHRLSRTTCPPVEFARGFDGEAMDRAGLAVLEAVEEFFPEFPPKEDTPAATPKGQPLTTDTLLKTCWELAGMCGLEPGPKTMRELWDAAAGAIDRDVHLRAFLLSAFGTKVSAEQVEDMHPLRRLMKKPPTEEQKRMASELGFKLMGAALKQMNQHRGK